MYCLSILCRILGIVAYCLWLVCPCLGIFRVCLLCCSCFLCMFEYLLSVFAYLCVMLYVFFGPFVVVGARSVYCLMCFVFVVYV